MKKLLLIISFSLVLVLSGCVKQKDYNDLKTKYDDNKTQLDDLTTEKVDLLAQIQTLTNEKTTLQQEKDNLNTLLTNKENEYDQYVDAATTHINEKQTQINLLNEEIAAKQGEIDTTNESLTLLQSQKTQLETDLATANSTATNLQNSIVDLNGTITQLQNDLGVSNNTITQLRAEKTQLEADLATANSAKALLQEAKTQLDTDLATANDTITQLQGEKAQLETDLTTCHGEKVQLEASLNTANTNITQLQGSITDLETQISTLNSEKAQLETDLLTANQSISSLQNEKTNLEDDLTEAQGQITQLQSDKATLVIDLSKANFDLTGAQADLDTANNTIAQLETDKADLLTQIATLNEEITNLENSSDTDIAQLELEKASLETQVADLEDSLEAAQTNLSNANTQISQLETEKASLETEISDKDASINQLETDKTQLQGDLQTAITQISQLQVVIDGLQTDLDNANDSITLLKSEKTDLEATLATTLSEKAQLQVDLQTANTNISQLQDEIAGLQTDLGNANDSITLLQSEKTDLEATLATTLSEKTQLANDLASANLSISELISNNEQLESDLLDAQNTNNQLEIQKTLLETDLETANNTIIQLQNSIDDLNGTIMQLQGEKTQLETDLATCQEQKAELEANLDVANTKITQLQDSITDLETQLSNLNSEKTQLETDLLTANQSISSLQNEKANLENDLTEAQGQITQLKNDKVALETDLGQANSDLTEAQEDLDTANNTIAHQETEKADLLAQIATLNEEITNLKNSSDTDIAQLELEKASLETQVADLEISLEAVQTNLNNANTQISQLETEKVSLETEISDKDASINQLETDKTQLQADLQTANNRISQLQVVINGLQTDLGNANDSITLLQSEKTDLEATLATTLSEKTQLISDLAIANAKISELTNDNAQLELDLLAAQNANEQLESQITAANQNIDLLTFALSAKQSELNTANDHITSLDAEIVNLTTTISQKQTEINGLNSQIQTLKDNYDQEIANLNATIQAKDSLLLEKDNQITGLNTQISQLNQDKLTLLNEKENLLEQIGNKDDEISDLQVTIADLQQEIENQITQINDYDYQLTLALRDLELYKQDLVEKGHVLVGDKLIGYRAYGSIENFTLHTVGNELGVRFNLTDEINLNLTNPDDIYYKMQTVDDIVIKYYNDNDELIATKNSFWTDFLVPVQVDPSNSQSWTHIDVDGDGTTTNIDNGNYLDRFGYGEVIPTIYTYSTNLVSHGDVCLQYENISRVEIFAVNREVDTKMIFVNDDFSSSEYGDVIQTIYNGEQIHVVYGTNAFSSIQDAVKAAQDGDTIYVYEGEYGVTADTTWNVEEQTGWYLPITQNDLTIQGMDENGNPINAKPDLNTVLPIIYGADYTANGSWASQNLITVLGDNVTIKGLEIMPKVEPNKTIEILGSNTTIQYNRFTPNTLYTGNPSVDDLDGYDMSHYGGSVYINEQNIVTENDINILNNYFYSAGISFDSASHSGDKVIDGNTFDTVSYYEETETGAKTYIPMIGTTSWASPKVTDLGTINVNNNEFLNFEVDGYYVVKNRMNGSFILENNLLTGNKDTDKQYLLIDTVYGITTGQIIVNSYQDGNGNTMTDGYTLSVKPDSIVVDLALNGLDNGQEALYGDYYYTVGMNAFSSIQDALKAAQDGDTIYVYEGEYGVTADTTWNVEDQTGWYLPITQNDLTIQGMDENGNPINAKPDLNTVLPIIYGADYTPNGSWASQNLITVLGNNVTIIGLEIMPKVEPNKTIEILGSNTTIQYNRFTPNTLYTVNDLDGYDYTNYGGSVYINEGKLDIDELNNVYILDNYFYHSNITFDGANHDGEKIIEGNTFDGISTIIDNSDGTQYFYSMIGTTSWADPKVLDLGTINVNNNEFLNFEVDGYYVVKNRMNGSFILENNLLTGNKDTDKQYLLIDTIYGITTGQIIVNSYQDGNGNTLTDGYTLSVKPNSIVVDLNLSDYSNGTEVLYGDYYYTVGMNAFSSIQDALKAAQDGDTIYVYEGEYAVTADTTWMASGQTGWYLPITQNDLTIQGMDENGNPINAKPDNDTVLPIIYGSDYTPNGSWASQDLIAIFGDNVTIKGLEIMAKVEPNKTIEILGSNTTIQYNRFTPNTLYTGNPYVDDLDGYDYTNYGGSVYINEGKLDIDELNNVYILDNYFYHSNITFDSANHDGEKIIEGNTFDGISTIIDNSDGYQYFYSMIGTTSWANPIVLDLGTINVNNNEFLNFEVDGYYVVKNRMNGSFILENNLLTGNKDTDKQYLLIDTIYGITTGQIIVNSYQVGNGNTMTDGYTLSVKPNSIVVDLNLSDYSNGTEVLYGDYYYTVGMNAFSSIQDALKAAQDGDTIYVYEGEYAVTADTTWNVEEQTGWYLPITQNDLTIQGMDENGNPINAKPDNDTVLPIIYGSDYTPNGSWASQDLIAIFGDNVTIKGLEIMAKVEPNKTIEILGSNTTIQYNRFTPNTLYTGNPYVDDLDGYDMSHYGGSVYINEGKLDIDELNNIYILDNYFYQSNITFDSANHDGEKIIEGNTFDGISTIIDNSDGTQYFYSMIGTTSWADPKVLDLGTINVNNNQFLNFEVDGYYVVKNRMNGSFILENNLLTGNKDTDKQYLLIDTVYGITTGQIIVNSYQDGNGNTMTDGYTLSVKQESIVVDLNLSDYSNGTEVLYGDYYYTVGMNAFSSIQDAVNAAQDGDTIIIYPGTYNINSTLTIDKQISLIGTDEGAVIINYTSADGYGILVHSIDVVLQNFTFNTPIIEWYPIKVEWFYDDNENMNFSDFFDIENVIINNNPDGGRTGLDLNNVYDSVINNVEVYNSGRGNGIALTDCQNDIVENVITSGNAWGGIAIYAYSYADTMNINLLNNNTFTEINPIYTGEGNNFNIINLMIPVEYDFVIEGSQNYYQTSIDGAINFATLLIDIGEHINTIKSISQNEYYVIPGLSIYDAVNAASEGATIYVLPGVYQLPTTLNIDKGIHLIGVDESSVIFDASGHNGYGIKVGNTNSSEIELTGFTLEGTNNPNYGIHFGGTINFNLHDVTVQNFNSSGIDLNTASEGSLVNVSSINNSGNGIQLCNSFDVTLDDITTSGNAWNGIGMFTNNVYYYNHEGIDNVVLKNIDGVSDGIYLEDGNADHSIPITYSYNLTDNANVTILSDQYHFVYQGVRADGLIHTIFYKTAEEAITQGNNPNYNSTYILDVDNNTFIVTNNMSIQTAIDLAADGDTILLADGNFTDQGTITINKNVTIIGQGNSTVLSGTKFVIAEDKSLDFSNVLVDGTGLTTDTGFISTDGTYNIGNVKVENVIFENMSTWAIYIYNGHNFIANNNTIEMVNCSDKTAIMVWTNTTPWNDVTITNNTISFDGTFTGSRGLQIQDANNVLVSGNTFDMGYNHNVTVDSSDSVFAKARYAMQISGEQNTVLITNNTIKNSYDGITTLGLGNKESFIVSNNLIENVRIGVRAYAGTDNDVADMFNYLEVSNNTFNDVIDATYLPKLVDNLYNTVKVVNNTYIFVTQKIMIVDPSIITDLQTDIPFEVVSQTLVEPTTLKYLVGTPTLDLIGGKIIILNSYGYTTEVTLTQDMISGYNQNKLGTQVITVTYNNEELPYVIVVHDYIANQTFDTNINGWIHDDYGPAIWEDGHLLLENTSQEYSFYNGKSMTVWPGTWYAEMDVYLDPNDFNLGEGFDYSQAVSDINGNYVRDYIIHVTKDTSTGELLVGASNNSNFASQENLESLDNYGVIDDAGWYTIQYRFFDNNGYLGCEISLISENGEKIFNQILSSTIDDISNIGGNRYSWFTFVDKENGLLADNYQMFV